MDELGSHQLQALSSIDRLLERAGITYWLFGGWAVDFYAGLITRTHGDIDIAVWLEDLPAIRQVLERRMAGDMRRPRMQTGAPAMSRERFSWDSLI